jgi:uncharacterized membrane protein YuzA (DUF378 family)
MFKYFKIVSYILIVIGAINWGLVGILNFDLVAALFGEMTYLTRLVYSLVGLGGISSLICYSIDRNI